VAGGCAPTRGSVPTELIQAQGRTFQPVRQHTKPENLLERNPRILVIDDNPAIHDDLKKILLGCGTEDSALSADESLLFEAIRPVTTAGFELESAYQGQEGLRRVQERFASGLPYALALVDVRMPPGWDGIETIG
jgi:CheY-like chemotaxis protein